MKVLVTGSSGLIGSEAVAHYASRNHQVLGIDNNLRRVFFGPQGDTTAMRLELQHSYSENFQHEAVDIRDKEKVFEIFKNFSPDYIIHSAAQPSHDWAAKDPFMDFSVNAAGTLNLLEALRQFAPHAVFTFLSTNKVYGDSPNHLPIIEMPTRFEFKGKLQGKGIDESQSVDQNLHSLFGASKLSADILCQEYGRYFGLNIGVFRGGCLTGSRHAGVHLHGFLSYLVDSVVQGRTYNILGYLGKQVRDQIHSSDVIGALECFRKQPRPGEVYNLGGGFENSASILEIIAILKDKYGLKTKAKYIDAPRKGDHICYYSNMAKFKAHYPAFEHQMKLTDILEDMLSLAIEKLSLRKPEKEIAA